MIIRESMLSKRPLLRFVVALFFVPYLLYNLYIFCSLLFSFRIFGDFIFSVLLLFATRIILYHHLGKPDCLFFY